MNSQTGVVTLETEDIPESASGLFMFVTNSEKVSITSNTVKLAGIEAGAEVNNISDANATSLTNGADNALHYHAADRNRANHTGTQTASTISNFNAEVTALKSIEKVNEIFNEDYFTAARAGENLFYNSASAGIYYLPSNSTEAITNGTYFYLYQYGTGALEILGDAGVTVKSLNANTQTAGQFAYVKVIKIDTNEYLLTGDLA